MCMPMHWMRIILLLAVLFGVTACDESTPGSSPACLTTGEPLSLPDTFHQLRACLAERSYRAMEPYIDQAGRDEVIELLIAMDELLAANDAALQATTQACPDMDVQPFDMASVADSLDLFSREVTYVSCEESGDRGAVTANVSGRLPLDRIEFVRKGDYWMYDPGPSQPTVTSTIREIALAMDRIVFVIANRTLSPDEIREEYRLRVAPQVRRLVASSATTEPNRQ